MSISGEMRKYSTLVAIKEMFGDKEFTEKQYSMIRELTGCHLNALSTFFSRYGGSKYIKREKETIYLNADHGEKVIYFDNPMRAPLSIKEYNNLPKGVHDYVAKNGVNVNGKVRNRVDDTSWRWKYKLKSDALDVQKAKIKDYCSDEAVAEIQQKIQRLVAQLETIKDVLKSIED